VGLLVFKPSVRSNSGRGKGRPEGIDGRPNQGTRSDSGSECGNILSMITDQHVSDEEEEREVRSRV
jgi:hypothetical protein